MSRRLELDALRGVALLGIAAGNVLWFSGVAVGPAPPANSLDAAALAAVHLLVDGKFYALFSLLFGASLCLMVQRERAQGRSGARLVRRRLLSLGILGCLHATLLWFGDILSLYAVAALPLYPLLRCSVRVLWRIALALLIAPAAINLALLAAVGPGDGGALVYGPEASLPAFGSGTAGQLLAANADFLVQRWVLALVSGRLPRLLGMFVLGVVLVRAPPSPPLSRRYALWTVALVSNLALVWLPAAPVAPPSWLGLGRAAIACVAIPTGSLAYVAWLWPRLRAAGPITGALAAAGRLSLTHYLGQSVGFAVVFYGIGIGAWGRVGATGAVGFGIALAAAQIVGSRPWLVRFGRGPGERALRAMDRAFTPAANRQSPAPRPGSRAKLARRECSIGKP